MSTSTGAEVRVRRARAEDGPVLAALGARTFREAYGDATPAAELEAFIAATYSPDLQAAEAARPDGALFLAERSGEAIGFALLDGRGAAPTCVAAARPMQLARIYVVKAAWRTGAGSVLLERCLDEGRARGHDAIWLQVWEENERALAFYRRHGFEFVGTHPFRLGSILYEDPVLARPL